jgi:ethanolamine utilization protein EutA
MLTEPLAAPARPQSIMFSGGVSEYIYGREARAFGDIAKPLAARIAAACKDGRIDIALGQPREGIRATVIGASQFTVQLSGKTIHVSDAAELPLRNVPVIAPALDLAGEISATAVEGAVRRALTRSPVEEGDPIALCIHWRGDPLHRRLHALASGIARSLAPRAAPDSAAAPQPRPAPLVLMIDGDVGRSLGRILTDEIAVARPVISIDGIQLKEFDFVDIGAVIRPAEVIPVVIKSLIFSGAPAHASRSRGPVYKPLPERKVQ